MRVATRTFILIALGLASAACRESAQDASANNAAVTDIETLPPDESVDAPAEELVNNAADPANPEGLVEGNVAG